MPRVIFEFRIISTKWSFPVPFLNSTMKCFSKLWIPHTEVIQTFYPPYWYPSFFTNDNIFINFLIFRLKIWKYTVLFSFDSKCFKTTEKLQEILICSIFSMTNMFLPETDSCRQIKQFRRKLLSCNKNINKKFFDRADYRFLLMSRLESSF